MSYSTIKQTIQTNVYDNTNQEIGGNRLRDVLLAMVDAIVGQGYVFGGVATSSTTFGSPEQRTFWMAQADFTHATLGEVKGGDIILWDGTTLTLKSMELSGGVFVAEYGTTTYAEVAAAFATGKAMYCTRTHNGSFYMLPFVCHTSEDVYVFSGTGDNGITVLNEFKIDFEDEWWNTVVELEDSANKKTTLTNSNTDYPTTKAVKTVTDDLSGRITNISTIGRFLSVWSLAGGRPLDNPTTALPYEYRRGDYYITGEQVVEGKAVTVGGYVFQPLNSVYNGRRRYIRRYGPVAALESRFFPEGSTPAVGDTMYSNPSEATPTGGTVTAVQDSFALIPTGDSYTGAASTVHAAGFPAANTMFVYTGTGWIAVNAQGQTVAFVNIAGQPTDNANLDAALNGKQDTISDLDTIRSGAALGATALQAVPNTYRTSAAQDVIDAGKQPKTTSSVKTYASGTTYTLVANEIATLDASAAASGDAITIALPASPAVTDCFDIQITLGANVPTINLPASVSWLGGSAPSFSASKKYEINIMNNLAVCGEF